MQTMLFLLGYWRRRPFHLAAIVIAALVAGLAEVGVPFLSGYLVDTLLAAEADRAWHQAATCIGGMALLSVIVMVSRHLIAYRVEIGFNADIMGLLIKEAFAQAQRFDVDWHIHRFSGALTRTISRGVWAIDDANDTLFLEIWPSFLLLCGFMGLLGWYWPYMGFITLLGTCAFLLVSLVLSLRWVGPVASESNKWDSRVNGALGDALVCLPSVKAFAAEVREEVRVAEVVRVWQRHTRRSWRRMLTILTGQQAWLFMLQIGMTLLALRAWANGEASAGQVIFVMTGYGLIDVHLRNVGFQIRTLQRALHEIEALAQVLRREQNDVDAQPLPTLQVRGGEIVFKQVRFRYPSNPRLIYEALSLHIAPGERVGLVGASGSGKSTLVRLLHRLYDLEAGVIAIDGQPIDTVSRASLRLAITIVPQDVVLFHRSIAENIAYARPDATPAEVREAARQAQADDFIMALPDAYATLVGERGILLSGGERQRIALARAFLADAPIVIFDEATASLDNTSEVEIDKAMKRLHEGRTTLTIAHRLSTVRHLDRILVFDAGAVVEQGNHETLMAIPDGVYRKLVEVVRNAHPTF